MSNMADIWQNALQRIRSEVNEGNYNSYFKNLSPVQMIDDVLFLEVPSELLRNIINLRYSLILSSAVKTSAEKDLAVELLLPSESARLGAQRKLQAARAGQWEKPLLNPKYTFDTFVVGNSNRFAHAGAQAVTDRPGTIYNPLFIYSGSGLGKTHLMLAIGHQILLNDPSKRVEYVTSETFTNELIRSIQKGTNEEFRQRFRNVDCLMIDDIQFIADKERTQEEFFHTFNALHETNKQIVITSDQQPKEIPSIEERLRSRFEWGLIADIQPPDYETRVAILLKKAQAEEIDIANEIIYFIAGQVESNIRVLEGALNRVVAYSTLNNCHPTIEIAQEALKNFFSIRKKQITPELIMQIVADEFGVKPEDFVTKRRDREISHPRQICMYLIREQLGLSLPKIGDLFGGRDHSTVMHACREINSLLQSDTAFAIKIDDIKERIRE
ncbi:MAG: chromosomal replication initiator protein DnaA [Bacillota bacterium]